MNRKNYMREVVETFFGPLRQERGMWFYAFVTFKLNCGHGERGRHRSPTASQPTKVLCKVCKAKGWHMETRPRTEGERR